MRRVIYVVVAIFALGAASCSKQDIRPNTNVDTHEPTWRSSSTLEGESCTGVENIGSEGTLEEQGITDPNNDPDESVSKTN